MSEIMDLIEDLRYTVYEVSNIGTLKRPEIKLVYHVQILIHTSSTIACVNATSSPESALTTNNVKSI